MLKPVYQTDIDWNFSNDFMEAARNHLGSKHAADVIVRQLLKASIDDLDGYNGRLNRSILIRPIVQYSLQAREKRFTAWGGDIANTPTPRIRYRIRGNDSLTGDLAGQFTYFGNSVLINQQGFNTLQSEISTETDSFIFNIQFEYSAGIATDLDSLPDDLKAAIFAMARVKYDYRDSYLYKNYPEDLWLKKVLKKYWLRPVN